MPEEYSQPITGLEEAKEKIRELHRMYSQGQLKGPEEHEVNPGLAADSKENYLYFTLPCSINFQRHSPRSALKLPVLHAALLHQLSKTFTKAVGECPQPSRRWTFNAPDTNFLFRPEEVGVASLVIVTEAMTKYRLALQTNKHTQIWLDRYL